LAWAAQSRLATCSRLLTVDRMSKEPEASPEVSGTRPIDWSCEIRLTVYGRPIIIVVWLLNFVEVSSLTSVILLIYLVIIFHANKLLQCYWSWNLGDHAVCLKANRRLCWSVMSRLYRRFSWSNNRMRKVIDLALPWCKLPLLPHRV